MILRFFLTFLYFAVSCTILAFVDAVWALGYAPKSVIKMFLFGLIPFALLWRFKKAELIGLFTFSRSSLKKALSYGVFVYGIIVGGYFLVKPFIDFSNITTSLHDSVGVSASNFLLVALYISLVNSFLEEFFFRGFGTVFFTVSNRWLTYITSAALFALYHVAMMIGWYDWWVFVLAISGLFVSGIVFHLLNQASRSLYTSWFVHMCSNLGINTVGLILFGIL